MCGLAGFYCLGKENVFNQEHLQRMGVVLKHRGPDANGYFLDEHVGFAHNRLSVVDLSSDANQPFYSKCGRYVMIYNGECYNALQLATANNIRLRTTSDTEAILELFVKLGPSFIDHISGMFIIIIYDKQEKVLHIYRDRFGIKPLFYYWDQNYFIFSSEIKGLLALDYLKEKVKINHEVISSFLHLGFVPEPLTFYTNIRKFPSGMHMKMKKSGYTFDQYYKLEDKVEKKVYGDFIEAKHKLKELLENSVNQRLLADVPVGLFLSGGIDSSLLAAVAQKLRINPIKTFTIGFEEEPFNEAEHARKVARFLGTDHYELIINQKDIKDCWEDVLDDFDEPFGDSSCYPTYLLSKFSRKQVTVALSGEGSDELFMGYGSHNWAQRLNKPHFIYFRKFISHLLSKGNNRMKRAAGLFDYDNYNTIRSHIYSQEQYNFSERDLSKLLKPEFLRAVPLEHPYKSLSRVLSAKEEQAFFDLKYYVKDDLLLKMDISSMACSLEVREPYLDYKIVEFALNLSEDFKIKGGVNKYILKEVLYDYIPKEYFERPKKGFSIPLNKWLKTDLRYLIEDYLADQKIDEMGIFNKEAVRELKNKYIHGGQDFLYNKIYLMIVLQRWLLKNKVSIH